MTDDSRMSRRMDFVTGLVAVMFVGVFCWLRWG